MPLNGPDPFLLTYTFFQNVGTSRLVTPRGNPGSTTRLDK